MRIVSGLLITLIATTLSCVDSAEDSDSSLYEQAYEDNQSDAKADGTSCSGVVVPDRNGFQKRIALTFDDGPNPATTPKVIQVLKQHHAPATFFNNGMRYNAAAKQIAAQIAADPDYILANHSQNHLNLALQSAAKVADEVDRTDALIRAAGETPKYFRFPFGSANCSALQAVKSRGYRVVGWHIDSADWCYAAGNGYCKKSTFKYVPDDVRDNMQAYVMSQVASTNGGIILFHDIHQHTADHLDAILTALEAAGYTFVRLDNVNAFPKLNGATPPQSHFIGEACTKNADCTSNRCHESGFCTQACAGTCPDQSGAAPTFCIAEGAGGVCVAKAAPQNQSCAALPQTMLRVETRYVGASGASAATANVCAPRLITH
jgi:peptidoglycan/xylan/chitin deacetylase (PgdA/CDA1 family)